MLSPERPGFWQRRFLDGIAGVSEALFPANDLGAPDWRIADMVSRTAAYVGGLPPLPRRRLRLLFLVVELAAPLLALGVRRFSRRSVESRVAAVRRWRGSPFYWRRVIGDALKAVMTMVYMSHPAVMRHLGMLKVCENPDDPVQLPIRPEALEQVGS